jgi:hypothetical protein
MEVFIFKTSHLTRPTVKCQQWKASHQLRQTAVDHSFIVYFGAITYVTLHPPPYLWYLCHSLRNVKNLTEAYILLWHLGPFPDLKNALLPTVLLVQFLLQTRKHYNNSNFDTKPPKVAGCAPASILRTPYLKNGAETGHPDLGFSYFSSVPPCKCWNIISN